MTKGAGEVASVVTKGARCVRVVEQVMLSRRERLLGDTKLMGIFLPRVEDRAGQVVLPRVARREVGLVGVAKAFRGAVLGYQRLAACGAGG